MKLGPPIAFHSDSALLWLTCVVALCGGYYIAFDLLGAAVDREHLRTAQVSAIVLANAETFAQRPDLQRAERAVNDQLRDLQLHADKPTTVARFIRVAATIAARNAISIVQIDERASTPAATSRPLEAVAFESIPLELTLTGSYRDLLAMIRELAQAPVTLRIEIAAIERASSTGAPGGGPLTAHLHIQLQRLPDATPSASL